MEPNASAGDFDVVIIGGALSGGATALLLAREHPGLRVLIIEKATAFGRKVGEATVEVSSYFLSRELGLTQHLNHCHLMKQGLRFWFQNSESKCVASCSEIGGRYLPRLPAYQLDRSVLDEEVLRRAGEFAEVWRPAKFVEAKLNPGGLQTVVVDYAGERREVKSRWIVDASGIAATLARANGWFRPNTEHPTTAVWSRWKGVKDWDGQELARKFPEWFAACRGIRGTATNHLTGDGWWAWLIPLKGGDMSIGVVFDQRLVQWAGGGLSGQQLKDFLCAHPIGKELLENAQWTEGDVHWRKNLPYYSTTMAGDGFVLVGDAAGFIDPFYSPGMDWISYSTTAAARLIAAERKGEAAGPLVEQHNRDFTLSYHRWFRALYLDKYHYMGDFELLRLAFLLDVALYYMGVAAQPYRRGSAAFRRPVFAERESAPFYHFMRFYNYRFARIARGRRAAGTLGRRNAKQRFLVNGFSFGAEMVKPITKAVLSWIWLELTEGWRTWGPLRQEVPQLRPEVAPGS